VISTSVTLVFALMVLEGR